MRILFAASEAFPLAKIGGLADVASSLALALRALGHEPCLILPRYGSIRAPLEDVPGRDFAVSFMGHQEQVALKATRLREGVPVYLLENSRYFTTGEIYDQNELERFLLFSLAIPAVISRLDLRPDIVHCHDWHAALALLWLKHARMPVPGVFTIHNLAYQGSFDQQFLLRSGLSAVWREYLPVSAPEPGLNFLSQGILLADIVTTVSPTYAAEILTQQHGQGLEDLLSYRRSDLHGIVNGIDYDEYNPTTDPHLVKNYDSATLEGRAENKLALQRRSGLPEDPEITLLGMVSRLEQQKGIELLLQAIEPFVNETSAQLVILGRGREDYHRLLGEAVMKHSSRLSAFTSYDEGLAHLIYAGCDIFLMPSRFEPCGLGQLIAMRYGAVPLVRRTGGLADTVRDVAEGGGHGFVFQDYTAEAMLEAIKRAEQSFCHRTEWENLMKRNMDLDFSWKASARRYEQLYLRARDKRHIRRP
jgi:starch synthase